MPTGFTAGVLDGKIKTFPEFAKICMRGMMPLIHMKEESFDAKYKPRKPHKYHTDALKKANSELKKAQSYSDNQIINLEKKSISKDKEYYTKKINEVTKDKEKLEAMRKEVAKWDPPTDEHLGFKKFMLEQLDTTIKHDGDTSYWKKELDDVNFRLSSINAQAIRDRMIEKANKDIIYHTKEHNEELERCKYANKWASDLLKSLSK